MYQIYVYQRLELWIAMIKIYHDGQIMGKSSVMIHWCSIGSGENVDILTIVLFQSYIA